MIRFFHQLRQRFIAQDHVRKYLIYAIGEIALVMIGILLALQVNNWNEERRADQRSIQYHQRLFEEAEIALQQIHSMTENDRLDFENARITVEALKEGKLEPEEKERVDRFMFDYFKFQLNTDNLNTFTEMLGAGELQLIRNQELRAKIADFVDFRSFFLEVHQTFHESSHLKTKELDQYLYYEFGHAPVDSNYSSANRKVYYDFEAMASDPQLIRTLSRQAYLWHESMSLQQYYKERVQEVYDLLKQELEKLEGE